MPGLFDINRLKKTLSQTNYYVLLTRMPKKPARLTRSSSWNLNCDNFEKGVKMKETPSSPLIYEIEEDDEGSLLPYFKVPDPVMSNDLINILYKSGVDNIELFDTIIREKRTGKEYYNYKVINIIGAVKCADLSKSKYQKTILGSEDKEPVISVWFDELYLDESQIHGFKMFRLAENISVVLVHNEIKEMCEAEHLKGIECLYFQHPEKYSG